MTRTTIPAASTTETITVYEHDPAKRAALRMWLAIQLPMQVSHPANYDQWRNMAADWYPRHLKHLDQPPPRINFKYRLKP